MSSEKMICLRTAGENPLFSFRTVLFYAWSMTTGIVPALSAAITVRNRGGNRRKVQEYPPVCKARWRRMGFAIGP